VKLDGKTCLITGAASGIGRATATAAAQRGARLVLTDIQAEPLAAAVEELGDAVLASRALDVTDHEAVRAFADDVHAEHGSLDVVMNVAGVSTWGAVDQLRHEDWRKLVEINLMGPIGVIEAFVPPMIAAKRGGHLVNVSSAAGLFGLPWHAAYSASKFGLRGVSEVLRFDLRRYRIGVTLVCPGAVDTPLVGTVDIVGVNTEHPLMVKMKSRFQRHAKSPEHVAGKIIGGIERNRYLVVTSPDIRALVLVQRYFPPLYELIMRIMNDQLYRVAKRAGQAPVSR
jgi:NAD(P)-dependent dehydrogenase (short-subunit alcohol dehydrogenase family)